MINSNTQITDIHSLMKEMVYVNNKFSGQIWWRGNSNMNDKLIPSVFRDREDGGGYEYEKNIILRFKQKAPALRPNMPSKQNWADWLFLMQHYGLPTRLLDWTESPLIASFFATQQNDKFDGALFALSPYRLNGIQINRNQLFNLDDFSEEEINQMKVVAILPDLVDQRMIAQLSAFTIHNNNNPLEEYEKSSEYLVKYEIPFSAKAALREQLKHAGIRPSSIFPDLEHLSEEIKSIRKFKKETELVKEFDSENLIC